MMAERNEPKPTPRSTSIVFFGSGPVAARSLQLLAESFDIEAVVTKPKPPHHRGEFPVITVAEQLGLKILYAANKQELNDLFAAKPVTSRMGVLIDFGIIVSQAVIDYFPLGIVNSHFSLLPEWRGADPISFAVLSGQPKTGVSLMLLDATMDTGKLLAQKSLAIPSGATTPSLTQDLIELSNNLLKEYLPGYLAGDLKPRQQPHPDRATYSRKLTKDDGVLDWQKPAAQLEREVRAFAGWPKSRTSLAGQEVVITKARVAEGHGTPGKAFVTDNKELAVQTADGVLIIESLVPAGKKEMSGRAFLAGYGNKLA